MYTQSLVAVAYAAKLLSPSAASPKTEAAALPTSRCACRRAVVPRARPNAPTTPPPARRPFRPAAAPVSSAPSPTAVVVSVPAVPSATPRRASAVRLRTLSKACVLGSMTFAVMVGVSRHILLALFHVSSEPGGLVLTLEINSLSRGLNMQHNPQLLRGSRPDLRLPGS